MLVTFAQNTTLVATTGSATTITTDPMPVPGGDLSKCMLTANVHRMFGLGTGPSFTLAITLQGSNDGQTWHDTDAVISESAQGNFKDAGDCQYAFARMEASLTVSGGDWATCVFDAHGNFVSA